MKKYFFISNRQSGKTHLAVYEFLKDPNNSLIIVPNFHQLKEIIDLDVVPDIFLYRIISCQSKNVFRGLKAKKIIFDDYLMIDVVKRSELYIEYSSLNPEEIFCFSTPNKVYDSSMFNFVRSVKKDNRSLVVEEFLNKSELLIEINDLNLKSKTQLKNEIWDLYYNHITDHDIKIIHDKYFYNDKLFKLNNVSYFPDVDKELTELRGEYLKN